MSHEYRFINYVPSLPAEAKFMSNLIPHIIQKRLQILEDGQLHPKTQIHKLDSESTIARKHIKRHIT